MSDHKPSRYRYEKKHCRCDGCSALNRAHSRAVYQRRIEREQQRLVDAKPRATSRPTLVAVNTKPQANPTADQSAVGRDQVGAVEQAVVDEVAELRSAVERPSLVEAARACLATAHHHSLAAELRTAVAAHVQRQAASVLRQK